MKLFIALFVLISSNVAAQNSHQIDHIEMYGETGKGDTAYIFFKNGKTEKQFLKTDIDKEKFSKKYAAFLQQPHEKEKTSAIKSDIVLPDSLHKTFVRFTFSNDSIWLTLKDGTKEKYDRNSKKEMQEFESKYGKFNESLHE